MNFKETFPLQVVINLDKRPDRYKICVEEEFPKLGITPIRKPGVIFTQAGNAYSAGVIGCLLSHYSILQAALSLNTSVFIFEDDVHLIGLNALEVLDWACEELGELQWDMFYAGANILKPFKKVTKYLAKLEHAQSTVCYGVNKNFIEKLLSYIDLTTIRKPIDLIYADDVIPYNNCYITIPMMAYQRDNFSDIEGQEVKYSEYLGKRYWDNFIE